MSRYFFDLTHTQVKKIATAMKRTAGALGTTQAAGYCFHFAVVCLDLA
jgi:hypothetical protein